MFQIRSQVGVLRKAVIDEQAKNSLLQVGSVARFENKLILFMILILGGHQGKRAVN
jgi:hypothetical protein